MRSEVRNLLEVEERSIDNDIKFKELMHLHGFVFRTRTKVFHLFVNAVLDYRTFIDTNNNSTLLKNDRCDRRGDTEGANSTTACLKPESNISNISARNYSYKIKSFVVVNGQDNGESANVWLWKTPQTLTDSSGNLNHLEMYQYVK